MNVLNVASHSATCSRDECVVTSHFDTPLGTLAVVHDDLFLYESDFINEKSALITHNDLSASIQVQLQCYFADPSFRFTLSCKLQGSPFQRKVWNALMVIPQGQTKTYGELAHELSTSARAIGQACKTNPLPLFIPCHRVVAKHHMGGYMGKRAATFIKESLLSHESQGN